MQRLGVGKLLVSILLLSCAKLALADLFTFTNIDVPGAANTFAYGINNLGQIVGAYKEANNETYGFLDSGGVFTTLDSGSAYGINDKGQIVGDFGLYSGGSYTTLFSQ